MSKVLFSARLSKVERQALTWLARNSGLTRSGWLRAMVRRAARQSGAPAKMLSDLLDDLQKHPLRPDGRKVS